MSDQMERELERLALAGDKDAMAKLLVALRRAGDIVRLCELGEHTPRVGFISYTSHTTLRGALMVKCKVCFQSHFYVGFQAHPHGAKLAVELNSMPEFRAEGLVAVPEEGGLKVERSD